MEAIAKRDDGIVILNHEECSGCQACIDACPYGAIAFDSARGMAQKRDLCYHRVDHGLLSACADNVCPAHCIYFRDQEEMGQRISLRAELTGPAPTAEG